MVGSGVVVGFSVHQQPHMHQAPHHMHHVYSVLTTGADTLAFAYTTSNTINTYNVVNQKIKNYVRQ